MVVAPAPRADRFDARTMSGRLLALDAADVGRPKNEATSWTSGFRLGTEKK
jgi:hypothetical protein